MAENIVELKSVSKTYHRDRIPIPVLHDLSLTIPAGEFVALMGPSGSGKTTLLNLIAGIDRPSAGEIYLEGRALGALSEEARTRLRRDRIGFVFQFFNLIPVLSAVENAALPLVLADGGSAEADRRADDWLGRVGLVDRRTNRPDQLSGGQQQRVAVARALVSEPALILADEPTGNLDSKASEEIAALLRQVASEWGRAILMVTHDPRIAAHADRIVFMRDGRVVDDTRIADAESARDAMERVGLL